MTFIMYFDREGQPLGLYQWAHLFSDFRYRYVAQVRIHNYWVSTLWFGLNNSWMSIPSGIYETAIFKDDEMVELFRHDTKGEAVRWHLWVCSMIVRYEVRQLGPGSKVTPSTDRGPVWQAVIATTDGQLVIVPVPSELTLSSSHVGQPTQVE